MQYTIPFGTPVPIISEPDITWSNGLTVTVPCTSTTPFVIPPNPEPQPITGWICPVCGGGVSPYTSTCPCTTTVTVTYSNQ